MASLHIFRPLIVITTSRRKSPLTNSFIKALSRVLGAPIIRRGTSNLDEIAYNIKEEGYEGFIVTYSRLGNPSVLTFYRYIHEKDYFLLFGRIFILGIYIDRSFRSYYEYITLEHECVSEGCLSTYDFLWSFFKKWKIHNTEKKINNVARIRVNELEEFRDRWILKMESDPKFAPCVINFLDHMSSRVILKVKVHHVWKSQPK